MRLPDVVLTEYGKQMANPDPEGKWEIANWAMPNTSILSIYTNNMLSHILTRCLGDHSFSFRAHLCWDQKTSIIQGIKKKTKMSQ